MANFVDIMGYVVSQVRDLYDSAEGKRPFYDYGHPRKIFNLLSQKDKSAEFKYDKYPLIALITNFDEPNNCAQYNVSDFTIIIVTQTDPNFYEKDNYGHNYNPILQPIYELLMERIKWSKYLMSDDSTYQHNKRNSPQFGIEDRWGNSMTIGNDNLDAIVITGLEFGINSCKALPVVTEGDQRITEGEDVRITENELIRITE